jgi:hypothetical protein
MPVSHQHRCIFVHIPKTGGTSIETALNMFHGWREENREAMFGLVQSPELLAKGWVTRFLQHLSMGELRELLPPALTADYLSFAWVRNPWDRMVSTYFNKDPDMVQQARSQGIDLTELSFRDFLERTAEVSHVHLLEQTRFVTDERGRIIVDFIGRFETLAADFRTLCERLRIQPSLPHRNASTHGHYRQYYTAETRAMVAARYGRDIEMFGYDF